MEMEFNHPQFENPLTQEEEKNNSLDDVLSNLEETSVEMNLEEDILSEISSKVDWKEISPPTCFKRFEIPIDQARICFEKPQGLNDPNPEVLFGQFFGADFWKLVLEQTNLYLDQLKTNKREYIQAHPKSRIARWREINLKQLQKWLALHLLIPIYSNNDLKSKK